MGIYTIQFTRTATYEVKVEGDSEEAAQEAFEAEEYYDAAPTLLEKIEESITSIDNQEPEEADDDDEGYF